MDEFEELRVQFGILGEPLFDVRHEPQQEIGLLPQAGRLVDDDLGLSMILVVIVIIIIIITRTIIDIIV